MNAFQERLQDLMLENNLNRLKLSKIIGISSTTINDYFNRDYYPRIDIAIKMAEFFHCSLDYLFGLSDDDKSYNNNNDFFENLSYLMDKNGKSVINAFEEMKLSDSNYYRWKAGMYPKTINLIEIAKYFDVSVDFLVGNIKNK